jgi:hypothetical protein
VLGSQRHEVYSWLQSTDPGPNHNAATSLYEEGTGSWVFRTSQWKDWIDAKAGIRALWIHGIPGAGKTVLAAHMIEEINRNLRSTPQTGGKGNTCIYYYCYHAHNQAETIPFLRWLTSQLLRQADIVPERAHHAFKRNIVDIHMLFLILQQALDHFGRVYVVIDALDETHLRENLLRALRTLMSDDRFRSIQLLTTSREYAEIQRTMLEIAEPLPMSNPLVEADIRLYVVCKMTSNSVFQSWPKTLQEEVIDTIAARSRGMFRWAVCQLDILRRVGSQKRVRDALQNLPETLDETYERIFSYIGSAEKDLVRHVLHWICFHDFLWKTTINFPGSILVESCRFLDDDQDGGMEDHLCTLELIKELCGCLISFGPSEQEGAMVFLAHYTVREFLESDRPVSSHVRAFKIQPQDSYRSIVAVLMRFTMTRLSVMERDDENIAWKSPINFNMVKYSSASTIRSIFEAEPFLDLEIVSKLLNPREPHYANLQSTSLALEGLDQDLIQPNSMVIHGFRRILLWKQQPQDSRVMILVNLLLTNCFRLAKDLVEAMSRDEVKAMFEERLALLTRSWFYWPGLERLPPGLKGHSFRFNGTVLELLAVFGVLEGAHLQFLCGVCHGCVDYTNILPLAMCGTTTHNIDQLLLLGASPNSKEHSVTPLQIAVCMRDLDAVEGLLGTGTVDPNNTGDRPSSGQRIPLPPQYREIGGLSPLYILRHLDCRPFPKAPFTKQDLEELEGPIKRKIEALLLSHNAIEIKGDRMPHHDQI